MALLAVEIFVVRCFIANFYFSCCWVKLLHSISCRFLEKKMYDEYLILRTKSCFEYVRVVLSAHGYHIFLISYGKRAVPGDTQRNYVKKLNILSFCGRVWIIFKNFHLVLSNIVWKLKSNTSIKLTFDIFSIATHSSTMPKSYEKQQQKWK